jgi:hypothetical protein
MHFIIISKENLNTKFNIVICKWLYNIKIKKFKFHKMCIKVHDDSNINNTSFVLFDSENV